MKSVVSAIALAAASFQLWVTQPADGAELVRSAFFGSPSSSMQTSAWGTVPFRVDTAGNHYILWVRGDLISMIPHEGVRVGVRSSVIKIGPDDRIVWEYSTINERLTGVAVDLSGNVTVVGYTADTSDGFVRRIDTRGNTGAPPARWNVPIEALPWAITSDAAGNLYITGTADERFQSTMGAVKAAVDPSNCFAGNRAFPCSDAFVLKLSSDGQRTIYATRLGGSKIETASDIAVGADGSAYIVGETNSEDFPTTVGAAQRIYGGGVDLGPLSYGDGFFVRLNPSGTGLLYSTYMGWEGPDRLAAISIDAAGSALVVGYTEDRGRQMPGMNPGGPLVALFSPTGSLMQSRRTIGPAPARSAASASISPDGRLFVGISGTNEIVEVNRGTLEPVRQVAVRTSAPPAIVAGRNGVVSFATVGGSWKTSVFAVRPGTAPFHGAVYLGAYEMDKPAAPSLTGIVNAGSYALGRQNGSSPIAVAPNEIVSIFGESLGSPARVTLGGRPLTVFYAGATQINVLVPSDMPLTPSADLTVYAGSTTLGPYSVEVAPVVPGFFVLPGTSDIAAINQDGTINSKEHPAPPGSIVALFGTGLGRLGPDGRLVEHFAVYGAGGPGGGMEVLYAGEAPELPGVQQVNVRIHPDTRIGTEPGRSFTHIVFAAAARFEGSPEKAAIWVGRR